MLADGNLANETFTQAHEWGRAIVQAYMGWYVFFVAGNIAMLGWIHTRKALKASKELFRAFKNIALILWFLNLGGIFSSGFILWYLRKLVGENRPLIDESHALVVVIFFAGLANTLALVFLLSAWTWVLSKRTYEKVSVE